MNTCLSHIWARTRSLLVFASIASLLLFSAEFASAATPTVKLNAASADGNNSGTARLGMHVTMTAAVSGATSTTMTWSLQGAGTLTSAGLYSAPVTMPASSTVVIKGTLASN